MKSTVLTHFPLSLNSSTLFLYVCFRNYREICPFCPLLLYDKKYHVRVIFSSSTSKNFPLFIIFPQLYVKLHSCFIRILSPGILFPPKKTLLSCYIFPLFPPFLEINQILVAYFVFYVQHCIPLLSDLECVLLHIFGSLRSPCFSIFRLYHYFLSLCSPQKSILVSEI